MYDFRKASVILVLLSFLTLNLFAFCFLNENFFNSNTDYEITLSAGVSGNSVQSLKTNIVQVIFLPKASSPPPHKCISLMDSTISITIYSLNKYPHWSKCTFT
jgi:hypothetical protein